MIHLIKMIYENTKYMREGSVTVYIDNLKVQRAITNGLVKAMQGA